jgi:4-azaleucine resistance transporter AzlC
MSTTYTRWSEFRAGLIDTLPLEIGAIPFGIIFGATAVINGISPMGALGMSLFVFAGSAQFIGAQLAATTPIPIIVLTTFVVNLRHVLYGATLAPHTKHLSQRWLVPLGFWLTDESFAVVITRYNKPDDSPYKHWYFLGSEVFMYLNWFLWTLVGVIAAQSVDEASLIELGLQFAMVVTFIGMVVGFVKTRPALISVVAAGITAAAASGLPNNLGLPVAALVGVAAGLIAEGYFPEAKTDIDQNVFNHQDAEYQVMSDEV